MDVIDGIPQSVPCVMICAVQTSPPGGGPPEYQNFKINFFWKFVAIEISKVIIFLNYFIEHIIYCLYT